MAELPPNGRNGSDTARVKSAGSAPSQPALDALRSPRRVRSPRHINPDHYLETENGRLFTPERGDDAWQRAYSELSAALSNATASTELYVVVGVQGAGKSTWITSNIDRLGAEAIFFDAALPAKVHRLRVIAHALQSGVPAVAVWINVPLEVALTRNRERSEGEQVPEAAVRSVFSMLERPTTEEGFARVIEVGLSSREPEQHQP